MFRQVVIRLAALNVAVLIVIVGLVLAAVFFGARYGLQRDVDRDLRQAGRVLASSDTTRLIIEAQGEIPGSTSASLTYVFDKTGSLLTGVPSEEGDLPDFESMRVALDGREDIRDASEDDDSRTISIPVLKDGELIGVVQVGRSIEFQRNFVGLLARLTIGIGILAMAVAAGGGVFLTTSAMRPIRQAFDRQRGFVADASHELRAPVAVIRADADALARSLTDIPESDAELLQDMQDEADHISVLIDRLVELARLDATQITPVIDTFDLAQLADSSVRAAQSLVSHKDIGIQLSDASTAPVEVQADRTHMRIVLLSLLENAVVHGGEPSSITVQLESEARYVWVSVNDTGRGMSESQAGRAFDRFYRGDTARTRSEAGVGLGLTIARSLIEINGGRIELTSAPGSGTTVRFSVPRSG